MRKTKIVKKIFSFLKRHDFGTIFTSYRNYMNTYTFINYNNDAIKIIITENISEKYVDLKIRSNDHKIIFFYEWNQLLANESLTDANELIGEIRKIYVDLDKRKYSKEDFKNVINLYSDFVKKNINYILTAN